MDAFLTHVGFVTPNIVARRKICHYCYRINLIISILELVLVIALEFC